MQTKTKFPFPPVESISQVFYPANVWSRRLFPVHFEEPFPFYLSCYGFQGPLCPSAAFSQYHAFVGVTDKFMFSPFQFLVQFIKHHVA